MQDLTIILFICTIAIFVVSYILKRDNPISWVAFFTAICSIGQTVSDTTLSDVESICVIIPAFYIMFMSGLNSMYRKVL